MVLKLFSIKFRFLCPCKALISRSQCAICGCFNFMYPFCEITIIIWSRFLIEVDSLIEYIEEIDDHRETFFDVTLISLYTDLKNFEKKNSVEMFSIVDFWSFQFNFGQKTKMILKKHLHNMFFFAHNWSVRKHFGPFYLLSLHLNRRKLHAISLDISIFKNKRIDYLIKT